MPNRWLQIKGDPSVRAFLFEQTRVESLFDQNIDLIHQLVYRLFVEKGAFHVKIHYSSSQLTCWFADDPYQYRVFVLDEVISKDFLSQFPDTNIVHIQRQISITSTIDILNELRRLRKTDKTIYLRNGSVNLINGMIGMTFSCDGAHYIDHKTFFEKLETFATAEEKTIQ